MLQGGRQKIVSYTHEHYSFTLAQPGQQTAVFAYHRCFLLLVLVATQVRNSYSYIALCGVLSI